MSTAINTNTTAFMATLNLDANSSNLSNDIEQLSTGLQINSASDNPSGLVISENMGAQLVGIKQATSNTNDAINETKTAESALSEVQSLLQSMYQVAVDASNLGVNDTTDVAADQAQITSAIQSINRISATTQFGNKNLLDGSANAAATTTAGSSLVTGTALTGIAAGRWTSANAGVYNNNTVTASTSTTAIATASTAVTGTSTYGGSLLIDGTNYSVSAASTLTGLNSSIAASGYTAAITGGNLTFTSTATGQPASPETFDFSNLTANNGAAVTFTNGTVTQGSNSTMTLSNGGALSMTSVNTVSNGNGGNTFTFSNGLVVSSATTTGAVAGTVTGTAGTSTTGQALEFQIGSNTGQTVSLNIQSTAADQLGQNAPSYTDANGNTQTVDTDSVQNLNVTTFKGAQDAMAVIDQANNQISSLRAQLGAFQTNVLQSNATSLGVAQQNLDSSQSTIMDADLASTVVQYTKDQILVQSATSALSYANQMPQYLLKLLQ